MLDMAKRLLPPIPYYSDDELDQIGRLFLWNTLAASAQQNVQIVKTQYRTGDSISIRGLNDNQQDQIMVWFGLRSNWHGGRVPVVQTIWMALTFWGVKWVHESTGAAIFGSG